MLENYYFALLVFILGFGFLVFVHELGHFLVAKWVGIRCTQFAVCMGQAIVSWRKGLGLRVGSTQPEYRRRAVAWLRSDKAGDMQIGEGVEPTEYQVMQAGDRLGLGETEYRLNWIPLGGYVKMVGQEDMDPNAKSDDPRAFNNKSIGARLAVISAGVIMNIITGFIFFIIAFSIGVNFPTAVVGDIAYGYPAATTYADGHEGDPAYFGLRRGDRITAIDDAEVRDMLDVRMNTALAAAGSTLTYTIQRPGVDEPLTFNIKPMYVPEMGLLQTGVASLSDLTIRRIEEDDPLYAAGVRPDMVVVAVNGQPVDNALDYHRAMISDLTAEATLTIRNPNTDETIEATLPPATPTLNRADEDQPVNLLGLVPATTVRMVVPDQPGEAAGMQVGDVLAQVADVDWPTVRQTFDAIDEADGEPVQMVVMRGDEYVDLGAIKPNDQGRIGFSMGVASNRIARVVADGAAASLKLSPGTRIVAIDGTETADFAAIQRVLQERLAGDNPPDSVSVKYVLNVVGSDKVDMAGVPVSPLDVALIRQADWVRTGEPAFEQQMVKLVASSPWHATVLGVEKTHQFMVQTYMTLLRLFQGSVAASNLHGPVGIVSTGTIFSQRGWSYLLFFLGLISVNLAVLNFLPIPIVDGGLAVFLLYEKITGKPPGEKIQTASLLLGLALLGGLFIFVTYHDILRIIG